MLGIGWRLRVSRPGYALIVQGGGVGLLYLTLFAAFRLYQLLPAALVFILLTAMAILSALLAVLQDSRSLAAMAVTGGFLAPLLASTGGGSHVMLCSPWIYRCSAATKIRKTSSGCMPPASGWRLPSARGSLAGGWAI
jgi:uncharacterized membrane protein